MAGAGPVDRWRCSGQFRFRSAAVPYSLPRTSTGHPPLANWMAHGEDEHSGARHACTPLLPMSLQSKRAVSGPSTRTQARCAGARACQALQFFRTAAAQSAASAMHGKKALALFAMLNVTAAQHIDARNAALVTAEASADQEYGLEIAGVELQAARAPQRSRLGVAPQNHGRCLGQSCNSGTTSCGVDVWCDSTTWQLKDVGQGYYSPDGDCSRSSCTSMEREVYADVGRPSYTASGGGVDQCPWGCGIGFYDGGAGWMSWWTVPGDVAVGAVQAWVIMCMAVGVGECSPPGSNSVSQW